MGSAMAKLTGLDLTLQVGVERQLFGAQALVTKITGWNGGGSAVRRSTNSRMNAHGSFGERGWREERLVSVEGEAWADTRADAAALVDEYAAHLADGTKGTVTVVDPDQGTRQAGCYLSGTPDLDWDTDEGFFFAFDLVCPDPRKYAMEPVSGESGKPIPGGGLVFPLFMGTRQEGALDFGTPGSDGTVTLTNEGTADTTVDAQVTGPAPDGFTITEVQTGRRLVYAGALPAGQHVDLNGKDGTVLLEGYADRATLLTVREWFRLPPKTSRKYRIEAASGDPVQRLQAVPAWW